jgi:ribosomal protein L11
VLDKVVPVPSTSLMVRRAFHKHTGGKWHAGQHGAPHAVTAPNGSQRTVGCASGGGDINFAEVLDIARLMRARELDRHRQAMQGQAEPVGRRRKTSPCIAKDLRGTIKEVLGVVHSMRGLVEGEAVAVWFERLDNDEGLIQAVHFAEANPEI